MGGGEGAGTPKLSMSMLNHVKNGSSCVLAVEPDIVSAKIGGPGKSRQRAGEKCAALSGLNE